ncbi:hypothetical protein BGZ70_007199 [Mortierella alpina]|uniref:Uncharacterized protein n=1 Tax=Mortierella alpina TaxID=64518 RepID=A0A9P6J6L2_MORAP|nr:hypothetical protein BGZ70_007199 [Mortierella alpina]
MAHHSEDVSASSSSTLDEQEAPIKAVDPEDCDPLERKHDSILIDTLMHKIKQLSDTERSQKQLAILYSDTFCPVLKYHAEILSEIVRVVPKMYNAGARAGHGLTETDTAEGAAAATTEDKEQRDLTPSVLAIVLSPLSDAQTRKLLPQPFQLDLFDRKRLIDIQIANTPMPMRSRLILDDTWAQSPGTHSRWSLKTECDALEALLSYTSLTVAKDMARPELLCVIEQTEAEVRGVPEGIQGKVIFIISKDREDRPKGVALKTSVHWIDRLFQRSGYSLEWIQSSVIPLYLQLAGTHGPDRDGQRAGSRFQGREIQVSARRPEEALTRVKVRQGQGAEVLEASVLEEIERSGLFAMQAIRKPVFVHLMDSLSLGTMRLGKDTQDSKDDHKANPFL